MKKSFDRKMPPHYMLQKSSSNSRPMERRFSPPPEIRKRQSFSSKKPTVMSKIHLGSAPASVIHSTGSKATSSVDRGRSPKRKEYMRKRSPSFSPPHHSTKPSTGHKTFNNKYARLDSPPRDTRYSVAAPKRTQKSPIKYIPKESKFRPISYESKGMIPQKKSHNSASLSAGPYKPHVPDMDHDPYKQSEKRSKPLVPASKKIIYDLPSETHYVKPLARQYHSPKKDVPKMRSRFNEQYSDEDRPIKYSVEDLEKIRVNVPRERKSSPTVRRILDPYQVKILRRQGEGRQPMFDREEIKYNQSDMRDSRYYEKNIERHGSLIESMRASNLGPIINFEVTQSRYVPPFNSAMRESLSDRWRHASVEVEAVPLDQDDRKTNYERLRSKKDSSDSRSSSNAGDHDFRFHGNKRAIHTESSKKIRDSSATMMKKNDIEYKNTVPEGRMLTAKRSKRSYSKEYTDRFHSPPPAKEYSHTYSKEKYRHSRSSSADSRVWLKHPGTKEHEGSQSPVPARRPDKYKVYADKYSTDKYSADKQEEYYKHNSRGAFRGRSPYRGRFIRGYRGRYRGSSFRARGTYRGPMNRGTYRVSRGGMGRGSNSSRGEVPSSSYRERSPILWKHDLYSRSTPES